MHILHKLPYLVFLLHITLYSQPFNYYPTGTDCQITEHSYYTLCYNEQHEQAAWVAYELTAEDLQGTISRTDDFREDPHIKTKSAALSDYRESGYHRGHLAPSADMKMNHKSMSESFYLSNMSPQHGSLNTGIWLSLEKLVRQWAREKGSIYITTGPIFKDNLESIGNNRVTVPGYYYKAILYYTQNDAKTIGFIFPNKKCSNNLAQYVTTLDSIESLTGLDLYYALPDTIEEILESQTNIEKWGLKVTSHKKGYTTTRKAEETANTGIWICNSSGSKKYHNNRECHGLNRCKSQIMTVTEQHAKELGKGKCGYCY